MLHSDPSTEKQDPIQHIVYLIMENHSFDQMLGCFQQKYPDLEGIDPTAPPRFNLDDHGNKVFQQPITVKQIPLDPTHSVSDVMLQISDNNGGFVKDFKNNNPQSSDEDARNVMGYYPRGFLPALHSLAEVATICDHWFASVPGPTWPNRLFALSGTSSGISTMPDGIKDPELFRDLFSQSQPTLYDRLNEKNLSWKIYCGDAPISLVFTHQRHYENLKNFYTLQTFFEDASHAANDFPAFSLIEPKYLGSDQNDDHPPHNTMKAEKLIADIYNAIRANKALWESTLFVLTYDEHGGFYDHMYPPFTVAPDGRAGEFDFKQLGLRVPTLLISPFVKQGVEKTIFDHTSLLKYFTEKWNLNALGERTQQANSVGIALDLSREPRQDYPQHIEVSTADLEDSDPELERNAPMNPNQIAIHTFADFLRKTIEPKVIEETSSCLKKALLSCSLWCKKQKESIPLTRDEFTLSVIDTILHSHEDVAKEKASTPAKPKF